MQNSNNSNEINTKNIPDINLSFGETSGPPLQGSLTMEDISPSLHSSQRNNHSGNPIKYNDNDTDYQPIDKYMGMFNANNARKKKKDKKMKIDAARLLSRALFYILLEYVLYLTFQLVSYFAIKNFWISTTYVLGTVLLLLYGILISFLIRVEKNMDRLFPMILKFLEFIVYLILISWGAAYLDFSFLSLSYVMIFNVIALLITVI